MPLSVCPDCKTQPRMSWFKAYCDTCDVELTETNSTRRRLALVPVTGFIIMIWASRSGTEDILAANPEDPAIALFIYYITIFAVVSIISAGINYLIRIHFSTYELPKHT